MTTAIEVTGLEGYDGRHWMPEEAFLTYRAAIEAVQDPQPVKLPRQ